MSKGTSLLFVLVVVYFVYFHFLREIYRDPSSLSEGLADLNGKSEFQVLTISLQPSGDDLLSSQQEWIFRGRWVRLEKSSSTYSLHKVVNESLGFQATIFKGKLRETTDYVPLQQGLNVISIQLNWGNQLTEKKIKIHALPEI